MSTEPLINNERGAREWQWLCDTVGIDKSHWALKQLQGKQRAYPLNIARILGVKLPTLDKLPQLRQSWKRGKEKEHAKIAEIKSMLT